MAAVTTFRKATKKQSRLRAAICGPTGSGKTFTALRLAYTFKGAETRVAVINTESGAIEKYLGLAPDGIPFDFDILTLEEYPPTAYTEAIMAAGREGYDVLIVDSLSHAWSGVGGALEIKDKTPGNSYTAWKDVTPMHNRMVEAILRSPCHIIVTMRSHMEYVLQEQNGKMVPQRVGMAPVQRKGMEYEFDIVADMDLNHMITVSKSRCPAVDGVTTIKPGVTFMTPVVQWLTEGIEVDPDYYAVTDEDLRKLQRKEVSGLSDEEKRERARQQAAAAAAAYAKQGDATPAGSPLCNEDTERRIKEVLPDTGMTPPEFMQRLNSLGYSKIRDIPQNLAESLYHKLLQRKSEHLQAKAAEGLASSGTQPSGGDERGRILGELHAEIKNLLPQSKIMPAKFAEILQGYGCQKITDLNATQSREVLADLQSRADGESGRNSKPVDDHTKFAEPGTITENQLGRIRALVDITGWPHERQVEFLQKNGCNSFRSLSGEIADELIAKLAKVQQTFTTVKN